MKKSILKYLKLAGERGEYKKQADFFLYCAKVDMTVEFREHARYFLDDKEARDIYNIILSKGSRKYTFSFGQSINNSMYYRDKETKQEYYCDGKPKKGDRHRVTQAFLSEFCTPIKGEEPSAYDVLSCLQKYEYSSFDDFCSAYGYSNDSLKALKIWRECNAQYKELCAIFTDDEMEYLKEIN